MVENNKTVTTPNVSFSYQMGLVISAAACIYGVLGKGFLSTGQGTLMEILIDLNRFYDDVLSYSDSGEWGILLLAPYVGYALIAVPIILVVISFIQSSSLKQILVIIALIEAGLFAIAVYFVNETMFGLINVLEITGVAFWALLIGVLGLFAISWLSMKNVKNS